jgi:hypothetical protein
MKYFALLLLTISVQARAQDSASKKTSWHMIYSIGFNTSSVVGSMQDFTEKHNTGYAAPQQKDGGGFEMGVKVQKDINDWFYLKSGLVLVQKNVNPQWNTYILYQDSLNTGYLAIPFLAGVQTYLNSKETIELFCETGILIDFAIYDKSYCGPDRVAFSKSTVVATYQISPGIGFKIASNAFLVLQYAYSLDLTPAYKETLYYGATNQEYFYGDYKYRTNSLSLSLRIGLH